MKSVRSARIAMCSLRVAYFILFSLAISSLRCYSADLVFIRSLEGSSSEQRELKIATQFYGLNLRVVTPATDKDRAALSTAVDADATVAVAIAANALGNVDEEGLFRTLNQRSRGRVPVLVFGLTPQIDVTLLRAWSGGAAIACRRLQRPRASRYIIGSIKGFTRQLTDLEVPFPSSDAFYFVMNENTNGKTQQIAKIRDKEGVVPVFIETVLHQVEVFLVCMVSASNDAGREQAMIDAFAEIGPAMLFSKYCAGERGWHSIHQYANLTIDDPWLREPYGHLHYRGLLAEMERHDFHSTIAFIPWNYDRSDLHVVSLIRNHSDKFSISIHGDNHDHKEFTDYRSKPLDRQIEDLKQSLARMRRFRELTGIPYDKVMIFPHSIGPEKTLAALKNNNYLATVNSSNVPMDAVRSSGLSFDLRAATLFFFGFPSIRRYSVEGPLPSGLMAVNMFLDNPLLFYCHQGFFASGIGAFNAEADYVNRLQPDTRWRSLGEIVRHMYVVKLRDDDAYDVLSFAGTISLENITTHNSLFYVRKQESDRPAMVTVDSQPWPYSLHDGYLETQIPVGSRKSRTLSITYRDSEESLATHIEKKSFRIYCLRMASDFRDITLARYASGRSLIRFYQEHGEPLNLMLVCALALVTFFILGVWRLLVLFRSAAAG